MGIANKYPSTNASPHVLSKNVSSNMIKNEPKSYKYESPYTNKEIQIPINNIQKNRPYSSILNNNANNQNKKSNENEKLINNPNKSNIIINKPTNYVNNHAPNNFLRPSSKMGLNKNVGENLKNSGNANINNKFLNILKK